MQPQIARLWSEGILTRKSRGFYLNGKERRDSGAFNSTGTHVRIAGLRERGAQVVLI
jgi:hypothetical protein